MKKVIILVAVLFVLSISSLCIIAVSVNSQNDTITITEDILYGDRSVAEGITVLSKAHYDYHLFWNTEYTIGENAEPKTEYQFYASEKYITDQTKNYIFQLDTDIRYGCHFDKPAEEQEGLSRVYKELYDRCENGKSVEETVYLKDVYEYYPLRLNVILPGVKWSNNDPENVHEDEPGGEKYVINAFREFFRIPVFEDHKINISIGKINNGISIGSGTAEGSEEYDYYFISISTYTDDTVYFTIKNKTSQGKYADFSLVPGGYGIYSFKYHEGVAKWRTGIEADSLANVYPLDPELEVEHLSISEDGKNLIIVGIKNGDTIFKVIDIATMTMINEIVIEENVIYNVKTITERRARFASGEYYYAYESASVKESDNFMMLIFREEFAIIRITESGDYEFAFTAKQPDFIDERFQYMDYYSEMVYDGEKLVIVNSLHPDDAYELCGYYMAIYDETGLIYYATYSSSLDVNSKDRIYGYNCLPANNAYKIILNGE